MGESEFRPYSFWTINLTGVLNDLIEGVDIIGPGANLVTVRRNVGGDYRIFNVTTTGTVTFSGMTISNGSTNGGGGGIGNTSGTVNVTNCTVSDNFANGGGGGIFTSGVGTDTGTVNVSNSTLSGNSASSGGGIYNNPSGTVNVTNCTLSGNIASGSGGGIYNFSSGTVTVSNSTLSGNSASSGGGIYNNGSGSVNVTNSTLSGNSAINYGGVFSFGGTNLKSSIIALNTATSSSPDVGGSFGSAGFNLIGKNDGAVASFPAGNPNANNDIVGTSASPVDPKLDPNGLQNNGGPTQTIALLFGSPAIDKGTKFGFTGTLTTDQRGVGFLRTVGNGTDVGAFEFGAHIDVVSRKVHGANPRDINLPLSGTPGVECRTGGASGDHQVIMTFPVPVTVGGVSVASSDGMATATKSVSNQVVTVDLHNVINAQTLIITLANLSDGTNTNDLSLPMSVLLGDTTGNGSVNASDISQTKSKSGQAVGPSNFRQDVTVNNSINASDIALVKSKSGTGL